MARVTKNKPKKSFYTTTYKEALPYLLEDFDNRCAYSMEHATQVGYAQMHVDHWDPRKKKDKDQAYENLFPATAHCNQFKSTSWPTEKQAAIGCRFLDPSKEEDYGVQIFEDPQTHQLIGTTRAAEYHIEACGLLLEYLRLRRQERADLQKILDRGNALPEGVDGYDPVIKQSRELLEQYLSTKIPPIPPPPTSS